MVSVRFKLKTSVIFRKASTYTSNKQRNHYQRAAEVVEILVTLDELTSGK